MPCRIPQVTQHLATDEELLRQERPSLRDAFTGAKQLARLVQLIKRQHLFLLRHEICVDHGEGVAGLEAQFLGRQARGVNLALDFVETSGVQVNEITVHLAMNPGIGAIMLRVLADPAVVVHGVMQRLRAIADVMAHHAHDVDDVLLGVGDFLGRAAFFKGFQIREAGFEFVIIFHDGPGQIADQLARVVAVCLGVNGRKILGMRGAGEGELRGEIVAEMRQVVFINAVFGELIEVDVMVGGVEMIEVGGVAPAVGFAGEEGDALAGLGGFNEGGEIRGQRGERELVDETMAFVIPSLDRKSTRLNSSHERRSRMPSSA